MQNHRQTETRFTRVQPQLRHSCLPTIRAPANIVFSRVSSENPTNTGLNFLDAGMILSRRIPRPSEFSLHGDSPDRSHQLILPEVTL